MLLIVLEVKFSAVTLTVLTEEFHEFSASPDKHRVSALHWATAPSLRQHAATCAQQFERGAGATPTFLIYQSSLETDRHATEMHVGNSCVEGSLF
jgi:hypothetical protein